MKLFTLDSLNHSSFRYFVFVLVLILHPIKSSLSQIAYPEMAKPSPKAYSEELIITTDRNLYISGEKVWMKICKLNGLDLTPGNVSKIVYVELLDSYNNPVNQLKTVVNGYSGSAVFTLPDTLRTGNYAIRSFTNWMHNFSEELYSYKAISVINPFKISDIKIPAFQNGADSILFFPEGGNLISGIEGRIGFKSQDRKGNPVKIKGVVVSAEGDTLGYVQTEEDGYGLTTITPPGNNNLFLITGDENGRMKKFQLPAVRNEGIVLAAPLKSEKSPALVKIRMSNDFIHADSTISIVIHTEALPGLKKKIPVIRGSETSLLREDLPPGLSHIAIVDSDETTLTERWVYNETVPQVNFKIDIPQNACFPREKIKVNIMATDKAGNPVESDFSVSVAKAVTVNDKSTEGNNIRQLPDLAKFNFDNPLREINDYLIFFNHDDLFSNPEGKINSTDPLFLPELKGYLISGTIRNRNTGDPLKRENISLSFVGKTALCEFAKTNEKGEFHFATDEQGMREIVIQPFSGEIKDYYVEIDNPFTPATKKHDYGLYYPDTSRLNELNNVIISMQINNIYEPDADFYGKNQERRDKPDFYGKPDNTILLSNYIEMTSLKEVVNEIIPGVSTARKNGKINFRLIYKYQNKPYENNPLVLVDGVPVYDLEKVLAINSRDLEKIDVFTTRYYISDIIMDGILHFVSKKGNLNLIDPEPSAYRIQYDLPQIKAEFQSPDYAAAERLHDHFPDFRNTLYWNPDMHSDATGKAAAEFYSSDESATYTITVEGITRDGKRGIASMPLIIKAR
jgi:hypothetical protein